MELLAIGVAGGFLAGAVGFGGVIVNPLVWLSFGQLGLQADVVVPAAFASALARLPLTAAMAGLSHARKGNVEWSLIGPLVGAGIVGAFSGSALATYLSGASLKSIFALFQLYVAWLVMRNRQGKQRQRSARRLRSLALLVGFTTGFTSSFLAIGGGVVAVPLLVLLLGLPLAKAVGTSCALMVINTTAGTLGYIYHGWGNLGMPTWSLGYVYLWPALLLTIAGMAAAVVGASFASRVDQTVMRWGFGILIAASGISILAF